MLLRTASRHDLGYTVIVHPPENDRYRAHCIGIENREPKGYLERNCDIVDESAILLALPKRKEVAMIFERHVPLKPSETPLRSGTWSTVRYALRRGTVEDVTIIGHSGVWHYGGWR